MLQLASLCEVTLTGSTSGSGDKTIRLWDAKTGAAISKPLQGHTDWVRSDAFSPDGARIASGSYDKIIRLWDVKTGAVIFGEPLQGHIDCICSVAFLPDGAWIASGSDDKTIRLWDAKVDAAIDKPLHSHTRSVEPVVFSPNSSWITSRSYGGASQLQSTYIKHRGTALNVDCDPTSLLTTDVVSGMKHPPLFVVSGIIKLLIETYPSPVNFPPCETLKLTQDGWIVGPKQELILWLPLGLRNGLRFTDLDVINRVDFRGFKCGTEWVQCRKGIEP